MKPLAQLKESYGGNDDQSRKFTALIRAGLFDAKKLPLLKRALNKDVSKMNPQERNTLISLLDKLMSQVVGNQPVFQKVRQNVMQNEGFIRTNMQANPTYKKAVETLKKSKENKFLSPKKKDEDKKDKKNIQELSRKTLTNYANKATHDLKKRVRKSKGEKVDPKIVKRARGISKAADKYFEKSKDLIYKGISVKEGYHKTGLSLDGVLGQFKEKDHKNHFDYSKHDNAWAKKHNLPHAIHVGKDQVRYGHVKKSVAHVAVDENPNGSPKLEKWNIHSHKKYVKEDNINESIGQGNIPVVLILKRRAIRLYPGGQIVALYYADKINKYITVPFSEIGISGEVSE